jgi:RAD51-like protein 2
MSTSTASHKLSHLPLRPSTLSTLERRGFVSTGELNASKRNGGMSNLAAELGCSLAEAASLMREVDSAVSSVCPTAQHKQSATALSLISKLKSTNRTIVSFSKSVDSMLGGGIAKGEVTEIVGLPGVGKTQLCMQLCVDARLPTAFGGVQGDAVYLDTEGSFSPERCFTMAKVCHLFYFKSLVSLYYSSLFINYVLISYLGTCGTYSWYSQTTKPGTAHSRLVSGGKHFGRYSRL